MIEGSIIYGTSHFFALHLLDLYWLWTLPHVGCFDFHVYLECLFAFPPKLSYYKLLLSSRCSISAIRAVLAYDCSWLSLVACITNIESVLAAYYSIYQAACMYRSFSSCNSLHSSLQSFCLMDHKSNWRLGSDTFCNPVIKWSDYLVGSCILVSIEFTW